MTPEDFEKFMLAMSQPISLPFLLEENKELVAELKKFERHSAVSIFGTMLLDPSLQSNCIRLDALSHLALIACKGKKKLTKTAARSAFEKIGKGICGRKEDPAEDVFTAIVNTQQGNFKVLEGIWESGTFYLQRLLDIFETFPDEPLFNDLLASVTAFLLLSNEVCNLSLIHI